MDGGRRKMAPVCLRIGPRPTFIGRVCIFMQPRPIFVGPRCIFIGLTPMKIDLNPLFYNGLAIFDH